MREEYSLHNFFNMKKFSSKIESFIKVGGCANCAILNESILSFLTFRILCFAKFFVLIGLITKHSYPHLLK